MSQFLTDRLAAIVQRMGPRQIVKLPRTGHFNIVPYQTTHTCGGAIMGTDPKTSAPRSELESPTCRRPKFGLAVRRRNRMGSLTWDV